MHFLVQEQYTEEGIEWDTVEVEFNETLIDTFHQVKIQSIAVPNNVDDNLQEGGLLEVFGLPSEAEMKAGVESCCHFSSNTCFMSGEKADRFTLAHYTGEYDYVIDSQWMAANRIHVVGSGLQTALQNSSCDTLVDMAQVITRNMVLLLHLATVCCRTCNIVQT